MSRLINVMDSYKRTHFPFKQLASLPGKVGLQLAGEERSLSDYSSRRFDEISATLLKLNL